MSEKKQIPRKHVGKKVTPEQERLIKIIQEHNKCSWLEAKHEYFENKPKPFLKPAMIKAVQTMKQIEKNRIVLERSLAPTPILALGKKKRSCMTIQQTKLGITMVLSKKDCRELGFTGLETTREAIKTIRGRLSLSTTKEVKT